MTDVALRIAHLHRDPLTSQRIQTGRFRINQELNEEWIDLENAGHYVLNLQGRILACIKRQGPRSAICLRQAEIRSNQPIPMHPGDRIRLFTGEQPAIRPQVQSQRPLARLLWMVQSSYLWLPDGHEAHLYFSQDDLRQGRPPLAHLRYR
jgi:hypothetical protein